MKGTPNRPQNDFGHFTGLQAPKFIREPQTLGESPRHLWGALVCAMPRVVIAQFGSCHSLCEPFYTPMYYSICYGHRRKGPLIGGDANLSLK